MIRIINGPVERLVKESDLEKWIQAGFKPVDPLPADPEPDAPGPEPEAEERTESPAVTIPDNLEQMKVANLRKLADKIGVQGYQNMDKSTLIAVIKAH